MNAAVSTGGVFALMSAMLFPAPLVADEEIVIGIGQSALLSIIGGTNAGKVFLASQPESIGAEGRR